VGYTKEFDMIARMNRWKPYHFRAESNRSSNRLRVHATDRVVQNKSSEKLDTGNRLTYELQTIRVGHKNAFENQPAVANIPCLSRYLDLVERPFKQAWRGVKMHIDHALHHVAINACQFD
jgi:hypothetical protein